MKNKMRIFAFRAAMLLNATRNFFRGFLLAALFASAVHGQTASDILLNPGSNYVDVGRGIAWGPNFNRTYILSPSSPNSAACIYIVNNNPTNSHTFTLSIFQSADPRVGDYTHNTGRFGPVISLGAPSPVGAGGMTSSFALSTAAAAIAFVFGGSSTAAGTPDTADVFIVQTTASTCGIGAGAQPVQGPALVGANTGLGNPVLIGGIDGNGKVAFAGIGDASGSSGAVNGLAIGTGGVGGGSTFSNVTLPQASPGGPLAVGLWASGGGIFTPVGLNTFGNCSTNSTCNALWVRDQGFNQRFAGVVLATNGQTTSMWGDSNLTGATFNSCRFDVNVTAVSGTGPTLDLYVQDSPDGTGTNWTDRVHFTQIITTGAQFAGISGISTGITPAAYTFHTLAVSTKVDGPIGSWGRYYAVLGGTLPSFTANLSASCK